MSRTSDPRPFWLAGRPATGDAEQTVTNPHDGRVVGVHSVPTPDQVERAVAAAHAVRGQAAALPVHVRAEALAHVARRLSERAEEIAQLISAENGKPIFWARGEVGRAVSTFRFGAEEARRFSGDVQRLDTEPAAQGRLAYVSRVPYGPVLAITPFNFPLNLVAHKVAPAIAVGAPILVKPAPATPLSALVLGEILAETDLPEGVFSVLPVPNDRAASLVEDPGCRSSPSPARDRSATPSSTACRASTSRSNSAATPPRSCSPTPTSTGRRAGWHCSPTTRRARAASRCSA